DVGYITRFAKLLIGSGALRLKWAIGIKLDERRIARDGRLYGGYGNSLRLSAEFVAETAHLRFEFLFPLFETFDTALVFGGRASLRPVDYYPGKLGKSVSKLIEQMLVLRVGAPAQNSDAIGHGIERTPFALQDNGKRQSQRRRVIWRGVDVQRDVYFRFRREGREICEFLTFGASDDVEGEIAFFDIAGKSLNSDGLANLSLPFENR